MLRQPGRRWRRPGQGRPPAADRATADRPRLPHAHKFAIVIPDGAADEPIACLGGKTPLQAAKTPEMDAIARDGVLGRSRNVPDRFLPGATSRR